MTKKNKVTFGLSNVVIAFKKDDGKYDTPIPIPGAVSWAPATVGEEAPFYADNGIYYSVTTNNGYSGNLSLALLPDDVLIKMFNWEKDKNGAIIELADAQPSEFALGFQVEGDQAARKTWYQRCKASRMAKEESTTAETTTINPEQLTMTVMPVEINGRKVVKATIEEDDTNKEIFKKFFESVYTSAKPEV